MGWSNGKLTYPFTKLATNGQGDFQQALHRNDLREIDLFNYGDVRLFAKYKGFPSPYDYTDRYSDSGSNRKTALINANYGIAIPTSNALGSPSSGFFYNLLNSALMWYYNRPNKNNNNVLRPMDFDGYIDYAVNIMAQLGVTSYMLDGNNSFTITWPDAILPQDDDCQLYPRDVMVNGVAVTNMYFGILLYYSASLYTWAAQNQFGVPGLGKSVTFTGMSNYAGKTVQVVPFLSSIAIGQGLGPSAAVTLASWNLAPVSVDILSNLPNWSVSGQCTGAYGFISYNFTVTNNTNVTRTMQFHVWLSDDLVNASTTVGTNYVYVTKTVAAGQSDTISGSFRGTSGVTYVVAIEGSYNGETVPKRIFSVMNPN